MLHYVKGQVLSLSWFSLEAHCERLSGEVAQRARMEEASQKSTSEDTQGEQCCLWAPRAG